ncbi:MAG TPA: HAMP domain-containing sensor histidine kinase [Gemmataceae bacterium]
MRWRIRTQILVPLLILLLGVAGIATWTALASANRARLQIETRVRNVAHTFSESKFPLNERILEQMKGLSGAELLFVGSGNARKATLPADNLELPSLEPIAEEDWHDLRLGPRVTSAGNTYLCSGVRFDQPRRFENSDVLYRSLYILYPEALWRNALWDAVWPSLVLGSFVGLASIALAIGVGERLSRRIRELERRTRRIAAGDFSPMPLPGRDDELRDLGQSVNEMAAKLAQLQETVQKTERLRLLGQLSGGLAHQLRNGLTGARLAVQLHARAYAGRADSEALQVALRQLTLLESNLKRLLTLGQTGHLQREPCSLTGLVNEAQVLLGPQCKHAGIDLCWQAPAERFVIDGDRGQLEQLILNVLGNAVEAAGPGGSVGISLAAKQENGAAKAAVVEVSDSGPGPPADVAPRLFEAFVTSKPEGVGLGLAVARQAAEAHGGSIGWRREHDRTCFRIELPVSNVLVPEMPR